MSYGIAVHTFPISKNERNVNRASRHLMSESCAVALKQFCLMLGNTGDSQAGYLTSFEEAAAGGGHNLRSMLTTASGKRALSTIDALRAVGDLAWQGPAEAHWSDAEDSDHERDPEAVRAEDADEETAAEVDLCRFGLEMSNAQVFGKDGDDLMHEVRRRKGMYNADAQRRLRLTKVRVNDVEVEVRHP